MLVGQGNLSLSELTEFPGAYAQIRHLDDMTNMYEVFTSDRIVLLDFEGDRCQACRTLSATLLTLDSKLWDIVTVYKVNVDKFTGLRESFGIKYLPTLILTRNGRMLDRIEGSVKKETLETWVEKHIYT